MDPFRDADDAAQGLAADVLHAIGLVVVVTDLRTGAVVCLNRAAERLTGHRSEDVAGRPVWETLIAPADRDRVRAAYADHHHPRTASGYDGLLVTASGFPRRVLWSSVFLRRRSGSPSHVVMMGVDVSSDRANAGVLGHLVRAATTGGAALATDPDGVVVFCSPGAEHLLGRTAEELVGRPFPLDLIAPAELEERAAELGTTPGLAVLARSGSEVDRRRRDGPDLGRLDRRGREHDVDAPATTPAAGVARSQTWTIHRPDGSDVSIGLVVHEVRNGEQHQGYLALAEDLTDRQRTHGLLVAALEQEQEASRRVRDLDRAKTVFVATVSHELRTPITNIMGYTELLQDEAGGVLTPEQRSCLDAIVRNSERLRLLTDDLLTLSNLEAGTFVVESGLVDLRDVVRAVEEQMPTMVSGRLLETEFEVPDGPVEVLGDGVRLERVLLNLIGNAVKFTPDGGAVSCTLSARGREAVIVVSDTGIGIPVEEQGELFTQFFRASSARDLAIQGTGLGLSIVAAILRGHGGRISVESQHLRGARFTVTLPLAVADRESPPVSAIS